MAKAYLIGQVTITNGESYKAYAEGTGALVASLGGRYLVRGGAMQTLEGSAAGERIVVIEFGSVAEAEAFYTSDDYAPLRKIRQDNSLSNLILVEGVESSG